MLTGIAVTLLRFIAELGEVASTGEVNKTGAGKFVRLGLLAKDIIVIRSLFTTGGFEGRLTFFCAGLRRSRAFNINEVAGCMGGGRSRSVGSRSSNSSRVEGVLGSVEKAASDAELNVEREEPRLFTAVCSTSFASFALSSLDEDRNSLSLVLD